MFILSQNSKKLKKGTFGLGFFYGKKSGIAKKTERGTI